MSLQLLLWMSNLITFFLYTCFFITHYSTCPAMSSNYREKQELFGLKERLEKNLTKDAAGGADEAIGDLLNVLNNFSMTLELLAETSIGQTLADVMTKFGDSEISQKARKLLKKWKKELKSSNDTNSSKTTSSSEVSKENKFISQPPSISTAQTDLETISFKSGMTPITRGSSEGDGSWGFEEEYANLEPRRLSMVQSILASLMLTEGADEYWGKFLAFNIDRELNTLYPDQKLYMSKARSIASNLRSNQNLREQVYIGECSPADLARMNPRELADKSVQEAIAQRKHDLEKGRQTDMYMELREKAQKAIGIDAEGGEFTCSRCKGTKTSHYSMQTRSSDEPMTVFVTCLTCKKRWRE